MTYNADLFDRAASQYDESPPFFRVLGEKLVEFARLPSGAEVLDIGAGKGAVVGCPHRLAVKSGQRMGYFLHQVRLLFSNVLGRYSAPLT
jgi:ubiquinone/menaquinone biosynthesis C-methylase UbiE